MHCPGCLRAVEDHNAACEAMKCEGCGATFCNICRQPTGMDAHLHLRARHDDKRLSPVEKEMLLRDRKATQFVEFLNRQVRHPVLVALVLLRLEEPLRIAKIDAVTLTIDSKVDLYVWPRLNLSTTSTQHQRASVSFMRRIVALAPLQLDLSPLLVVCRAMPELWCSLAAETSAPLPCDLQGLTLAQRRSTWNVALTKLINHVIVVERNVLDCMVSAEQLSDHLTRLARSRSVEARACAAKVTTERWPCPELEQTLSIFWNTTRVMCAAAVMYHTLAHRTPEWRNKVGRDALMTALATISGADHPVAQYIRDYWYVLCCLHANPHAGSVTRFRNGYTASLLENVIGSLSLSSDSVTHRWASEAFAMLTREAKYRTAAGVPRLTTPELVAVTRAWIRCIGKRGLLPVGTAYGKELAAHVARDLHLVLTMLRPYDPSSACLIGVYGLQLVKHHLGEGELLACVQQHQVATAECLGALARQVSPISLALVNAVCSLTRSILKHLSDSRCRADACLRACTTMSAFFFVVEQTTGRVSVPSLDFLFAEARRQPTSPQLAGTVREYAILVREAQDACEFISRQDSTAAYSSLTQKVNAAMATYSESVVRCLAHVFVTSPSAIRFDGFLELAVALRRAQQLTSLYAATQSDSDASSRRRVSRVLNEDVVSGTVLESRDLQAFDAITTLNFLYTVDQWCILLRVCAQDLAASKTAEQGGEAAERSMRLVDALRHAIDAGVDRSGRSRVATTSRNVYVQSQLEPAVSAAWPNLVQALEDRTKSSKQLRRAYRPWVALHASATPGLWRLFSHGLPPTKWVGKARQLRHLVSLFEHLSERPIREIRREWEEALFASIRAVWQQRIRHPMHSPHLSAEEAAVFLITRRILAHDHAGGVFRSAFRARLIQLVCVEALVTLGSLVTVSQHPIAWTYYCLSVLPSTISEDDSACVSTALATVDCSSLIQAWPKILQECVDLWNTNTGFFTAYQTPLTRRKLGCCSPLRLLHLLANNACASKLTLATWKDRFQNYVNVSSASVDDSAELMHILDQVAAPTEGLVEAIADDLTAAPQHAVRLVERCQRSVLFFRALMCAAQSTVAPCLQLTPQFILEVLCIARKLVSTGHARHARILLMFVSARWQHDVYNFAFTSSMSKAMATAVRQLRVRICNRKRKARGKRTSLCRLLATLLVWLARVMRQSSRHTVAKCHLPIQAEIVLLLGQRLSCVTRFLPGLVAYADALHLVHQFQKVDVPSQAFCSSLLRLMTNPQLNNTSDGNFHASTQVFLQSVVHPSYARFSSAAVLAAAAAAENEMESDEESTGEVDVEAKHDSEQEDAEVSDVDDANDESQDEGEEEEPEEEQEEQESDGEEVCVTVGTSSSTSAPANLGSVRRIKRKKRRAHAHRAVDKHVKTR